jgi:hypothetical protein
MTLLFFQQLLLEFLSPDSALVYVQTDTNAQLVRQLPT